MESLQELNPDKDRASDAQIMFFRGLTLIATSIIGYRAAAGAANPADVMLPCIITSYWYYCRFFNCWNQAKINFKSASLVAALMGLELSLVC
jgi:spore maturation protein SpmA